MSIIAPFFDVPSLKKEGKLNYHSLLFYAEKPKGGVIEIHGGTLFDYVFVFDEKLKGRQRMNFIIQQYLEGLLNLMEENDDKQTTMIRGTSYILNTRTAERLGFRIVKTDLLQRLILTYNYFNILITNSIAKGKLSFPKLKETKTIETELINLIERKYYIKDLNEKLKVKLTN